MKQEGGSSLSSIFSHLYVVLLTAQLTLGLFNGLCHLNRLLYGVLRNILGSGQTSMRSSHWMRA